MCLFTLVKQVFAQSPTLAFLCSVAVSQRAHASKSKALSIPCLHGEFVMSQCHG